MYIIKNGLFSNKSLKKYIDKDKEIQREAEDLLTCFKNSLASTRDKHPQSAFNELNVVIVTSYRESMSMVIPQLLLFLLPFIDL